MVKYLLMIFEDENRYPQIPDDEVRQIMAEYQKVAKSAQSAGVLLSHHRLQPTSAATTVRVKQGSPVFTDGPFAETKEHLGGYFLIDVKDLAEALKWASMIPSARTGSVEVRPIWE